MSSKMCNKCGVEQSLNAFFKNRNMKDGYLNQCKECSKLHVAEYRAANLPGIRAQQRKSNKNWVKANPQAKRACQERWKARNYEKVMAHRAVEYAVKAGRLIKAPCVICGSPDVHGHHDSYAEHRRLDVVWLCHEHHFERHKTLQP